MTLTPVDRCDEAEDAGSRPWIYVDDRSPEGTDLGRTRHAGVGAEVFWRDGFDNSKPRLSPDGEFLVFYSSARGAADANHAVEYALRQMPVAGGKPRELTHFYPQEYPGPPAISPDGVRVAFFSYEPPYRQ